MTLFQDFFPYNIQNFVADPFRSKQEFDGRPCTNARNCNIQMAMAEHIASKINSHHVKCLPLPFVDCHSKSELYWKLMAMQDEREVFIFKNCHPRKKYCLVDFVSC